MTKSTRFLKQILVAISVCATILLCASGARADKYDKLDRLRLLNQNMANLTGPKRANLVPCGTSNYCRAGAVATKILKGDYDVVVMQEEFDGPSMEWLISMLGDTFPYYLGQYDAYSIGNPWFWTWEAMILPLLWVDPASALLIEDLIMGLASWQTNSGLAMFSKWPILPSSGAVIGFTDVQYMDEHTREIWDDKSQGSPVSFVRFDDCYHPGGSTPMPWDIISDGADGTTYVSDCFAAKGVAVVRLGSPTGRIFNVFFTHPQASYGGKVAETRAIRDKQLFQINNFIQQSGINQAEEEILLVGDLNINGDQEQYVHPANPKKNDEWVARFDQGPPPGNNQGPLFPAAPALKDSWTYSMGAHWSAAKALPPDAGLEVSAGIDPGLTWNKDQPCMGNGNCTLVNGRLDYVFMGETRNIPPTPSQGGRTPMAVHHTAVSYNIGDGTTNQRNAGITSATSPGIKIYGSVRPISDHWGLSAEIAPMTPQYNPLHAFGIDPVELCKHNPCDQAVGLCEVSEKTCYNDDDCYECVQTITSFINQPGVAQWYKIDSPGTYTFRVNHFMDDWASTWASLVAADNGMHMEIYQPTDLSSPKKTEGDAKIKSKPGGVCNPNPASNYDVKGCPFEGDTYSVVQAPFYVKVWYQRGDALARDDWPMKYDFTWQRSTGETPDLSFLLKPSEIPVPDDTVWHATAGPERWHKIRIDRADTGQLQHLRFDVVSERSIGPLTFGKPLIKSLTLTDSSYVPLATTKFYKDLPDPLGGPPRCHFQIATENLNPPQWVETAPNPKNDDLDDQEFYLLVERDPTIPPQDMNYQIRWDTDLTWMMSWLHKPDLAGIPRQDLMVDLDGSTNDTTGDDEIAHGWRADSVLEHLHDLNDSVSNNEHTPMDVWGHNPWGEALGKRRAIRYVTLFESRIVEWDAGLTGNNDWAPYRGLEPLFPLTEIAAGHAPNPATQGRFVSLFDLPIGWGANDGNYRLRGLRANHSSSTFCFHPNDPSFRQCKGKDPCVDSECVPATTDARKPPGN